MNSGNKQKRKKYSNLDTTEIGIKLLGIAKDGG